MNDKRCPLISIRPSGNDSCMKEDCEWWVAMCMIDKTEHSYSDGMCSIKAIALKNSDGHIVV